MRTIRFDRPQVVSLVDTPPPPPPGPGEAQVRTCRMGVCGTDIGGYLGKFPFFSYPRIPGHELGVEVVAVGEGVRNVQPGDRCAVEPYMNCGTCFACRHGSSNCCVRLEVIGVMCDGGLRERFNIRADKLHASARLSFEQLALVETLAIGCHAVDRGERFGADGRVRLQLEGGAAQTRKLVDLAKCAYRWLQWPAVGDMCRGEGSAYAGACCSGGRCRGACGPATTLSSCVV